MDQYEIEQLVGNLTRSIEELTYRIYTMEDSLAQINAQVEELKEVNLEEEYAQTYGFRYILIE